MCHWHEIFTCWGIFKQVSCKPANSTALPHGQHGSRITHTCSAHKYENAKAGSYASFRMIYSVGKTYMQQPAGWVVRERNKETTPSQMTASQSPLNDCCACQLPQAPSRVGTPFSVLRELLETFLLSS